VNVDRRPLAVELASPLSTADGRIDRREGWLVRVALDVDGDRVAGVGEATPLAGWTETREACDRALADALEALRNDGLDPGAGDATPALATLSGTPAARHAVTGALADLEARLADRPLADRLLAGPVDGRGTTPGRVSVNATVGDADPDRTAAAVTDAVAAGYPAVKVKIGARGLDTDLERVRRALAVVEDAGLRLDANGAWDRDRAGEAVERLAALDGAGAIEYVEQPVPDADLRGLASLADGPLPIAVDETLGVARPETVLSEGLADVLVLKPQALGGLDRAGRAARLAREASVGAVVSTTVDAAVARAGAVHLAAAVDAAVLADGDEPRAHGLATADRLATDCAPDPAPVADGAATVPDGPGLGVDADEVFEE
jgi:o-succinylbenzoate synthase